MAIFSNNRPDGERYIKNKVKVAEEVGINATVYNLLNPTKVKEYLSVINDTGIIIQLPFTDNKTQDDELVSEISMHQDVDGLSGAVTPATALGVFKYLEINNLIEGKSITIIGRSQLVGMPLAKLLLNTNATVTLCHSKTNNLNQYIKNADVIVCAVGKANFIKPETLDSEKLYHIVDVGINFEDGKLVGDVPAITKDLQNVIATPVPGGVGLLTTACLMENTLTLYKQNVDLF